MLPGNQLSALTFGAVFLTMLSGCETVGLVSTEREKFCALPNETCRLSCNAFARNLVVCNQRCDSSHYACLTTGCFPNKTLGPQCETFSPNHSR